MVILWYFDNTIQKKNYIKLPQYHDKMPVLLQKCFYTFINELTSRFSDTTSMSWLHQILFKQVTNVKQLTKVDELLHWERGRRVLRKSVHLFRYVQLWAVLQHDLSELHVDLRVKSTDLETFSASYCPRLIRCSSQSLTFSHSLLLHHINEDLRRSPVWSDRPVEESSWIAPIRFNWSLHQNS